MSTTALTPELVPSTTGTPTAADPLSEVQLELGRASAEISAINHELDRLALAKAQATAKFNHACRQLARLKEATA